jgi:hypothetical protein
MKTISKAILGIVIVLLLIQLPGYGQRTTSSTLDNLFFLDMSVPDVPALKALGGQTSNLLKTSDVREFVAAFDAFNSDDGVKLPKSFAVEFSPGKAMSKNWTMQSYQDKPFKYFLYNSALSIGTNEGEEGSDFGDKLAVGFRFSWAEKKGDILRDDDFIANTAIPRFTDLHNRRNALEERFKIENGIPPATPLTLEQRQKLYEELETEDIDEMIKAYSEENWNATRIDFAAAWTGKSKNNTVTEISANSFSLWMTFAFRIGRHGQFLAGPNFHWFENDDLEAKKIETSFPGRFYLGSNSLKGFIEYELKIGKLQNDTKQNVATFNSGFEFRMKDDFWITYTAGIRDFTDDESKFVTDLKIHYAFAKKK